MKSESKRKILVAGMGTSPAVLTNAVWALAHQKKPGFSNHESLVPQRGAPVTFPPSRVKWRNGEYCQEFFFLYSPKGILPQVVAKRKSGM